MRAELLNSYTGVTSPSYFEKSEAKSGFCKFAEQILSYGELFSDAKYERNTSGGPSCKAINTQTLGNPCPVVNIGLKIGTHVKTMLSTEASPDEKFKSAIKATCLTLNFGRTELVEYLPTAIKRKVEWLNNKLDGQESGGQAKETAEKIPEKTSILRTKEKLEVVNLGLSIASTACSIAKIGVLATPLQIGNIAVAAAIVGIGAANMIQNNEGSSRK